MSAWLQTLALQHNRLTSLPPTVRGLASLTDLSLTHNELVSADFVPYLPSLTQVTLALALALALTLALALPLTLTSFTQLGLSHNRLASLPTNLIGLTRLHSIGVAHNLLSTLPDELLRLPRLTAVCASHNRIGPLLPSVAQAIMLRSLDVQVRLLHAHCMH